MNIRMILRIVGIVLLIEGTGMVPSFIVSLIYAQGDAIAFLISILITAASGFLLYRIPVRNGKFYARDGFAAVSLGWTAISLFGSMPFVISGAIPSFIDAFFETVSGFTTTGSSILKDIESLPKGILFWRSFTNFMGGMGVLVFTLAVIPSIAPGSIHIMNAESTGPSKEKLVPKLKETVRILYTIYVVMATCQIILLLIAGIPLYDSLVHAFASAGTGGFSNRNLSVGAYGNVYAEVIITVFTILFGVNFGLYYRLINGDIRGFFKDEEFRFYIGTILVSITLITIDLYTHRFFTLGQSLRHSSFQVGTIITTTGFSTTDFNLWPTFSKIILVMLMLFGACAGSTGGGIKCIRILLLLKTARREIARIIHPRAVHTVKVSNRVIDENTVNKTLSYFFIYMSLFFISVLLISLDGKDLVTSATAVLATLSNIGPGFEAVGPTGNFSDFSAFSKLVFSFDMLAGRLEFYPIFVLISPEAWKRGNI
ncbi:potassium transporter KefA [Thermoclostridium stercorarium subsp. leptospartum DSM 9219]|uniref:Potassium transporter KefA n=1 Tax=Thermoclostridium stercorarium subsp. leptospartum DSM 9219 TaxID=1346611 RepID=A0A1B1YHQ4_THEST|nr:TrkH family potassium uptake protein [Thermoclostridium stercorarium]ANX00300.1 potassium transporter KefA [Thermoclostridium stercorarium subsp. leptospartum DSM 9219]